MWEPSGDAVRVIEEGHRKVIGHYQQVLRTQTLTATERAMIEERIAREEVALDPTTHVSSQRPRNRPQPTLPKLIMITR